MTKLDVLDGLGPGFASASLTAVNGEGYPGAGPMSVEDYAGHRAGVRGAARLA